MLVTNILFSVRVPALSEQMTLTQPRVSTVVRALGRILFGRMRRAIISSVRETHTGMPNGKIEKLM